MVRFKAFRVKVRLFHFTPWNFNMSLDKAIEHYKEHRKPYRGSKVFDVYCRNHKGCQACLNNRLIQLRRMNEKLKYNMKELNIWLKAKPLDRGYYFW